MPGRDNLPSYNIDDFLEAAKAITNKLEHFAVLEDILAAKDRHISSLISTIQEHSKTINSQRAKLLILSQPCPKCGHVINP